MILLDTCALLWLTLDQNRVVIARLAVKVKV